MPKTAKTSSNIANRRSAPYPVPTTQAIAPALSMATHAPTSPQPSGADRHASQAWPPENDEMLMRARQQGLNWQPIASQCFPGKTANACRKRHERLMEKRTSAESWDGVKIEELAKAYNDVRERMWKILADRVGGEKWQTVEAKVSAYFTIIFRHPSGLTLITVHGEGPQNSPNSRPHSLAARTRPIRQQRRRIRRNHRQPLPGTTPRPLQIASRRNRRLQR